MLEPISIDFASLNFSTIIPMLTVVIGALLILIIDLFSKNIGKSFYIILAVMFLLLDFAALYSFAGDIRGMFDLMLIDGISMLSQGIIILGSILYILLSFPKLRFNEYRYPEFFALYLFSVAGLQFMVSSDNLILIFLGLETSSLAIYTMIAMHNKDNAIEASIKYFTIGALAAAFFAFGSMLIYVATGSIDLEKVALILYESGFENYLYVLVAVMFMLVALGFKLSLFPFHIWVADVYEGSNPALVGFLSTIPKIAGFVVVLRFFEIFIASRDVFIESILFVIIVLTMTIPNVTALLQRDVKRMLAYSSIANAGFVMSAILIGTTQATTSLFFYWILFLITNLGAFGLLWLNQSKDKSFQSDHNLNRYKGLASRKKGKAIILSIFLLSLAGIPPFALFWGKLYLLGAAVNVGYYALAFAIITNSVIAAFYYLRPIVYMFLKEGDLDNQDSNQIFENIRKSNKLIITLCAFLTVFAIIYLQNLLEYIAYYVQIAGF